MLTVKCCHVIDHQWEKGTLGHPYPQYQPRYQVCVYGFYIPKNHLRAIIPPKSFTAAPNNVNVPKENIMMGRTLEGPYFFPSIPIGGANRTYGA
jgi:hypothetical protein